MIDGDDRTALKEEANMMIDVAYSFCGVGLSLLCVSVWSLFHALFDSLE